MALDAVYKATNFNCVPCKDCDVPGYLILLMSPTAESISGLQLEQLSNLGPVLAQLEDAVIRVTKADRVYILRFSEGSREVHFHIFPRTAALADQYLREVASPTALAGEGLFAWARQRFQTEVLSQQTMETAARIRAMFPIGEPKPRANFGKRLTAALRNTYGFESPEVRSETRKKAPLIWIPAFLMFFAKMLWEAELIRFLNRWLNTQKDETEVHPAWSDYYTLSMPLLTLLVIVWSNSPTFKFSAFALVYAGWRLFEDVGSSFHSLVTRAVFGGRRSRSEFRYLVATIVRAIEAWLALILMWNLGGASLLSVPSSISSQVAPSTLQVAYFVSTSLSTVGYGDFTPNPKEPTALILAIVTQFTGIAMLSILVSKAFSLVSPRVGPVN
jgi:diadenosine tetraphosphate (Ap4A) HIT family hydrolase